MTIRHLKAFTLIEMLIAMTLLSIMVLLLFSSLKIAANSWQVGDNRAVEVNKKAVVYLFFKRHLSTIQPLLSAVGEQTNPDGLAQHPIFLGMPQSIRFAAALPMSAARKGVQIFEIGLKPDDPSVLVVNLMPYQQEGSLNPERVELINHVKTFLFSYYGQKDLNASAVWQNDWAETDQIPKLIKVSILLDDNSFWPDMIIPVKITGHFSPSNIAPDVP